MAADGYARATGKVGVCSATSGPGATNLVTGLASAQMDSVPIVCITGQVPRAAIGRDAFQETDITGITLPVTKHNYLVMDVRDLAPAIKEAFYIARTGRPGPVLVDVPKDVLAGEMIEFQWPDQVDLPGYSPPGDPDPGQVAAAARLINAAQRPVILAGHGVLIARAWDELRELAEKAQIPVITTLLGIGALPTDHMLHLGMPGMHGMAYASLAIDRSDLVISLGARFDDRVTGRPRRLRPPRQNHPLRRRPLRIQQKHPRPRPRNGRPQGHPPRPPPPGGIQRPSGLDQGNGQPPRRTSLPLHPQIRRPPPPAGAQGIVRRHQRRIHHRHRASASTKCGPPSTTATRNPNSLITSGGSGAMGFEVPAALGAKVGRPDKTVWSIAGDGGFQMTLCDLATAVENGIAVKYAILNNGSLGMVRQWQDFFYEKDFFATIYSGNPDFVKLAEAYGIRGIRVTRQDEVAPAIQEAMETPGPVVVDFVVKEDEFVYPMIPAGESVHEMLEEPETEGVALERV